jgi:hypothetical protein
MSSPATKKYSSYLWIVAGFILLAFLYCYPVFSGKKLSAGDNVSWKAASHEASTYEAATGISPLWSNCMFGGMPTYSFYLQNPKNYLGPLHHLLTESLPQPVPMFFLAMLGFFILSCTLGFNRWIGVIGAIAYAFSTYNPGIIAAGHNTKMFCIAYMPGVLAGFLMIFNGRRLSGAALMALCFALMIPLHQQIVYYTGLILLIAGIAIAIQEVKNKRIQNLVIGSAISLAITALAIAPALPHLLPTAEYTKYTMRGGASELKKAGSEEKKSGGLDKDYAFRWSNGAGETFCLLVPEFYGGSSAQDIGTGSKFYETMTSVGFPEQYAEQYAAQAPLYWGPQPMLMGPIYFGAVICFLFVLGIIVIRSPHKWWIIAASVLSILMGMGKNFPALNYFLFDHLPLYNKFRAPTMSLTIAQLMFPLLGIWTLNDIFTAKVSGAELWKKIKTATIITAGLCILLAVGSQMFADFKGVNDEVMAARFAQNANNDQAVGQRIVKALQEDRSSMAFKSSMTSAFFILAAAALLWGYAKNKLKKEMVIGGLALLVAIDLIPTASRYLNKDNYKDDGDYEAQFIPRPVDQEIMKDKDPYYRVLDLSRDTYNDALQCYFHKAIGGYSPAKMESYQDLIDVHMSRSYNSEVLNYIIFNGGPNGQPVFQPNPGACGNAWFVSGIRYVQTANEEMDAMNAAALGDTTPVAGAWNARQTAIIRKDFAATLGNGTSFTRDSAAYIKLEQYGLNDLSFVSANSHEGLAVFSDIYYDKGWKAYIDEKEVPIIKANYVLRALKIPAGNHKIAFHFRPETYYRSSNLAMVGSLLIYLLIGAAVFMAFRKKDPADTSVKQ